MAAPCENGALESVYCGSRRVDVCDGIASLETGGALQKLIATVDLSIRCASSSEATEDRYGGPGRLLPEARERG